MESVVEEHETEAAEALGLTVPELNSVFGATLSQDIDVTSEGEEMATNRQVDYEAFDSLLFGPRDDNTSEYDPLIFEETEKPVDNVIFEQLRYIPEEERGGILEQRILPASKVIRWDEEGNLMDHTNFMTARLFYGPPSFSLSSVHCVTPRK
jgi:hypothetical protein